MKPDVLLQQVREVLSEIDHRLSTNTFNHAEEGYPTSTELMVIRDELKRVETELLTSTVPEKNQRSLAIGRIVTDGWDFNKEPLAKKLMAITDVYKRKLV